MHFAKAPLRLLRVEILVQHGEQIVLYFAIGVDHLLRGAAGRGDQRRALGLIALPEQQIDQHRERERGDESGGHRRHLVVHGVHNKRLLVQFPCAGPNSSRPGQRPTRACAHLL